MFGILCARWFVLSFVLFSGVAPSSSSSTAGAGKWSTDRATRWYSSQPWLVGSNFVPSTAMNELEMWQKDTFDIATIDRELGWAESLGMNTMRVFLHNLVWQEDSKAFLERLEKFLSVAEKHTCTTPVGCKRPERTFSKTPRAGIES